MKRKSMAISACFTLLCVCATLTSCGNSGEISTEIPESSSKSEISAEQSTEDEDTAVEETTEATEEETTAVATIPIEERKEKVNQVTRIFIDEGIEEEIHYCFLPEEATDISDDINLGLIIVNGKEFDITALSNAYGEDEIRSIFNEQAGLYTTDQLIKDGVFDDVYIATKGSPFDRKFLFGESKGAEGVEVNQEAYSFPDCKGKYDFITVEYVNDWFRGLYSESVAMNLSPTVEQITVNGEEKTFVEEHQGYTTPQFTPNNDGLITYTDKNIAIGNGTTYSDLVTMFGAEPTRVDYCYGVGNIYAYRNSTVTVGFVTDYSKKAEAEVEEDRNNSSVIAIFMWLND